MKTEEVKQHQEHGQQKEQKPKVPIIRLKLKVKEQQQQQQQQQKSIVESSNSSVTESSLPLTEHKDVVEDIKHEHDTSAITTPAYYGTFRYRPFKLFPLLPPNSLYRVLIPSKYTQPSNPALKLHYLWGNKVFTDDSDLVCLLARTQEDAQFWGKRVLVEVQVVEKEDEDNYSVNRENDTVDAHVDAVNTLDTVDTVYNGSDPHPHTLSTHYPHPQPRKYHKHDGNYIKIVKYTVNPSSVHLKRWRKRTIGNSNSNGYSTTTTPAFKPGNPTDSDEQQATQSSTKKIAAKTPENRK